MDRCPACSRSTRFYGVVAHAAIWLRWDICDACEAFFVTDEAGAYLWGRRAIDRNGYPWLPPRGWFGVPAVNLDPASNEELAKLVALVEAAHSKKPGHRGRALDG